MSNKIKLELKRLFQQAFKDGLDIYNANQNKVIVPEINLFVIGEIEDENLAEYYKSLINDFINQEKHKIASWEELFKFMYSEKSLKIFFELEETKFRYSEIIKVYSDFNWKKMLLFKDIERFIDFYSHDYSDEFNQLFFDMLYEKWEKISFS